MTVVIKNDSNYNECIPVSYLLAPYPISEYDFPEPVWP